MVVAAAGMGCMGDDMAVVHMVGHMEAEHMEVAVVHRQVVEDRRAGVVVEHMASSAEGDRPAAEVAGEQALPHNKSLGAAPPR